MTANPLERAVIEAARKAVYDNTPGWLVALHRAVQALEAWEATQDPEVREVGWHEVAEGDQLKSVRNGKFYPVRSTQKNKDGHRIVIALGAESTRAITRPTAEEPTAFVKRGAVGAAVDVFVNVFSSREAK